MDSVNALEELKKRYRNSEVSALIGSGFSKNVASDYPSWDELLHDMVAELYKFEIESNFKFNGCIRHNDAISFRCYEKKKIKEIIDREGYLNIVSKYIERKGFREAIEVYIEERIPHVNEDKMELVFPKKNTQMKITREDLSLHKKLLEGAWDNIYTTNYDTLIEYTALKEEKQWNTIFNGYELSFSKQKKSIIKIHGNLRNPNKETDNKMFEFDGNHLQRYIISKEDYDQYPVNHEAFTQLMRISLLQGCFCLLGFSGDDPNFITWIKWVRDILVRDKNDDCDKNQKVFLITVDNSILSSEKQLFYQNHRICNISLQDQAIRRELGVPEETMIEKTRVKELLTVFLSYLYKEDECKIIHYEDKRIYQKLWTEVFTLDTKSVNDEILIKILKLKGTNRIIKYAHYQKDILSNIYNKIEFDNLDVDIILAALEDTYFLPQYYPKLVDKLEDCKKTKEQTKKFELKKERYNTLHLFHSVLPLNDDASTYEHLLRIVFSFDFKKLYEKLSEWAPMDIWLQKKASMMSLFDKETAKSILLDYIDSKPEFKERYYATQFLNIINGVYPFQYSTVSYENQNIDGLFDLKNAFVREVTKEKKEIKPYGYSGKTHTIGGQNIKYENALRVLQFLIESGTMINFSLWTFIDAKEWYKVFYELYEEYPYPILYYSIQCSDNDILRRIGQDYAYSDKLFDKVLPNILSKLLTCILNNTTPSFFKNHILIIAQELFISVNPHIWEEKFMKIWKDIISLHYHEINENNDYYKFAYRGLRFIKKSQNKNRVILDCLTNAKTQLTTTINYLYYLQIRRMKISTTISSTIDKFVSEIEKPEEFTIVGNLRPLLSHENIATISDKIGQIITGSNVPEIALRSALYFAKDSKKNSQIIKYAISNHNLLWDSGIRDNSASPARFIHITNFEKFLKWDKYEIEKIFEKLKTSFSQLIESSWYLNKEVEGTLFSMNFEPLLDEMSLFLFDYEKYLRGQKDYQIIRKSIFYELNNKYKHEDVMRLIISDDSSEVISGLNQLYHNISISSIDEHLSTIYLILDKMILKKQERLIDCFKYISIYLNKYLSNRKTLPSEMEQKLLLILQIYSQKTIWKLELDVPETTKYLIDISDALKKHHIQSESIDYWQELKKSKRFNWNKYIT